MVPVSSCSAGIRFAQCGDPCPEQQINTLLYCTVLYCSFSSTPNTSVGTWHGSSSSERVFNTVVFSLYLFCETNNGLADVDLAAH
jgi:hypothetical protein